LTNKAAGAALMMDRAIKANRPVPQNSNRSKSREVTAASHGNACRPENKKKARPQRPGFFVFRVPQLVG
jgi:ribosomal protein L39E